MHFMNILEVLFELYGTFRISHSILGRVELIKNKCYFHLSAVGEFPSNVRYQNKYPRQITPGVERNTALPFQV